MEDYLGLTAKRAALAIAHPGHELQVHGWLSKAKPWVFVLTDGTGSRGKSRILATAGVLERAGARQGDLFGRFLDRQIYQAVLRGDVLLFKNLADELAREFVKHRIEIVVGDAEEHAILTHDLWRAVVNRAIELAEDKLGQPIANYEFLLEGTPGAASTAFDSEAIELELNDDEVHDKMSAAQSFLGLSPDIDSILAKYTDSDFRWERLRPAYKRSPFATEFDSLPRYELHGERQVAAGIYSQVVRYHQHVLPILQVLRQSHHDISNRRSLQEVE